MSRCLIQDVADAVAAAALAKEEDWSYALPKFEEPPATVAISLDGTCLLMCEDGWRETMVGTLAFYDREGERQHTIYLAATPEYGKAKFLGHLEAEIGRAKAKCPEAHYVGIADGAKGNWEFLGRHTDVQVTDFWHAAEYLGKAAVVLYRGQPQHPGGVAGRCVPSAEARAGRGRVGAEAVAEAGPGTPLGQGRRGCAAGDHVLREPVGCGPDGLRQPGGGERADRQRGDGGGVQGDRQAAAVRLGDEVDGGWCGGGAEPAGVELHAGAMGSVLVEGRSVGIPCRRLSEDRIGFTSNFGRTRMDRRRVRAAVPARSPRTSAGMSVEGTRGCLVAARPRVAYSRPRGISRAATAHPRGGRQPGARRSRWRSCCATGADVSTAHGGMEEVESVAESHPDLILMDLGMPTVDGYEAARRIRAEPGGSEPFLVALAG